MAADRLVVLSRVDPPGDSLPFTYVGTSDGSLEGHDGGFEVLDRPGRVGAVRYAGVAPFSFTLKLLTSRVGSAPGGRNGSVEEKVTWLRLLAEHRSWMVRPPTLALTGPLDYEMLRRRWVCNGVRVLDDQTLIRDDETGLLAQARIDLLLLEDVRAVVSSPVQQAQQAAAAAQRTEVVLFGEDGLRFAARVLGDPAAWLRIAAANSVSPDPLAVSAGQVLRLP